MYTKKDQLGTYQKKSESLKWANLRNRADVLFSRIVRSIGRCECCGRQSDLECSHIISRRFYRLRWDLRNAICMCRNCHVGWHRYNTNIRDWYYKNYCMDFEYLDRIHNLYDKKPSIIELRGIISVLKLSDSKNK